VHAHTRVSFMFNHTRASCRTAVNVCVWVCGCARVCMLSSCTYSTGAISAIIGHENLKWLVDEVHNAAKPMLGAGKPKVTRLSGGSDCQKKK